MKWRDTEGKHAFADKVAQACGIYSMQGLLIGGNGQFTTAVEACELDDTDHFERILGGVISPETLYVKSVLAQRIGVPLYLLVHRKGTESISFYEIEPDHEKKVPVCVSHEKRSPEAFIAWWRERKQTVQTKAYRNDMKERVKESYFDDLLERSGEKWGGNIDGYQISWATGDVEILNIIENRFTNKKSLGAYDPDDYFAYGGGDYHTWAPLIRLRDQLGLPLFLATYSHRAGEERMVGLTRVEALTEQGVTYCKDEAGKELLPCNNIRSDLTEIRQWLADHSS